MSVVLSGRGLCVKVITRPEESHRLRCVVVCDLENLVNEEAMAHWGLLRRKQTSLCGGHNEGHKVQSAQSVIIVSLIWQRVSTSKASRIKYTKGIADSCCLVSVLELMCQITSVTGFKIFSLPPSCL